MTRSPDCRMLSAVKRGFPRFLVRLKGNDAKPVRGQVNRESQALARFPPEPRRQRLS
jgi:hypothetical protein